MYRLYSFVMRFLIFVLNKASCLINHFSLGGLNMKLNVLNMSCTELNVTAFVSVAKWYSIFFVLNFRKDGLVSVYFCLSV